MAVQWKCPFCQHAQIVQDDNRELFATHLEVGTTKYGKLVLGYVAVRCVNQECNELYLDVSVGDSGYRNGELFVRNAVHKWRLLPGSMAKHQPDFIPETLREDYYEACLIRDKSPKASATLSRRCLQGMIRDFCNISKKRLIDEINELKKQVAAGSAPKGVEEETIEAIDAIRKIGNIGAHMEADINLVIDVEEGEAQALIELIELLFDEWYVARYVRQQRLAKVKSIAAEKDGLKNEAKAVEKTELKAAASPSDMEM